MKRFILFLITSYQHLTAHMPRRCVFYPTCSAYAKEAIERYGVFRGGYLGVRRILRCHPWQDQHIDPVP